MGNPRGWLGIDKQFGISTRRMANTGFEPDMRPISKTKPYEWERWDSLWWDPVSITPKGCYWKEVDIDHPALALSQLWTESPTLPSFKEILLKWFNNSNGLFHRVCNSIIGILRHTGGRGKQRHNK